MDSFRYTDGKTPAGYECTDCPAFGCKMWRQSNAFADNIKLLCVDCALKSQNKVAVVDSDGKHLDESIGMRCDQIGWLVPAVPTECGETYWGYTSVPDDGVKWWKQLPTRRQT